MPRYARKLSANGIYHIMLRGNEKKEIFMDDEDRLRFLYTLQRMKSKVEYCIYAYCLMNNHIHLLLGEKTDKIQRSMKRICVSYAYYFNYKYSRIGHLFQDRFKSENIDGDAYLTTCTRYIHNNPVKAGLVEMAGNYNWSSFQHYTGNECNRIVDVEIDLILSMFSQDREKAVKIFEEYSHDLFDSEFIEYSDKAKKEKVKDLAGSINNILKRNHTTLDELKMITDKTCRNRIVKEIKETTSASTRDLARITGLSKDLIFRA